MNGNLTDELNYEKKPENIGLGDEKHDSNWPNDGGMGSSIETVGLTWHQTKAEFELVEQNTTQDYFSYHESLLIYTFLLEKVRSQHPDRFGRVAKRRVETSDGKLWARYRRDYCGRRNPTTYRAHFRATSHKLLDFPGLSDIEKLDLYYGLSIKVPKSYRKRLAEQFDVEFDEQGVITGSIQMEHWDVVHPETDEDTDDKGDIWESRRKAKWQRFTEKEDGVLWQQLLEWVNQNGQKPPITTKKFWEEIKEQTEQEGACQRLPDTYKSRYFKFLAPNLHLMPFDIETKAALYQTMEIPVHESFRQKLISITGVTLNDNGLVTSYSDRPDAPLVLQSCVYESVIGISSSTRVSVLRSTNHGDIDPLPYSEEEEKAMWEFIRHKIVGPKQKAVRIRQSLTGKTLWEEFQSTVGSRRFTKSLIQHFNKNMIPNILNTDYEFRVQLELLFALNVPLEDDMVNLIRSKTTTLHLNSIGAIRHVSGNYFAIGKSNEAPAKIPKKLLKEIGESWSFDESQFWDIIKQPETSSPFTLKSVPNEPPVTIPERVFPCYFAHRIPVKVDESQALLLPPEEELDEQETLKMFPSNSVKYPWTPRPFLKRRSPQLKNKGSQKKRVRDSFSFLQE